MRVGDKIRLPDDVTVGYIVGECSRKIVRSNVYHLRDLQMYLPCHRLLYNVYSKIVLAGVTVSNKIWEICFSEELDYLRLKGKNPQRSSQTTASSLGSHSSSTLFHCLFRGSYGQ